MNRYIDFDEETDGKRYSGKDMARLGCNDCNGCHKCCTGMGKSIVLDPYDIYMLKSALKGILMSLLIRLLSFRLRIISFFQTSCLRERMSIAHFLMITEDAAYMSQDQDSAGCFLLEEYMKTALSVIFTD